MTASLAGFGESRCMPRSETGFSAPLALAALAHQLPDHQVDSSMMQIKFNSAQQQSQAKLSR
jgi:hypothetical protein